VVIFEITRLLTWSSDFINIYGQRFIGLEDPGNLTYVDYGVPDPEAPYPMDFIIDQNGIVRYWSWEYDPQEIISTIDGLLATSVGSPAGRPPVSAGRGVYLVPPTPNPTKRGSNVSFRLFAEGAASLGVYDLAGREVRTLIQENRPAGDYTAFWDGRDEGGRPVASGVYFMVLEANGDRQSRRAVLLR